MELKAVVLFLILNQLTLVVISQEINDSNVYETGEFVTDDLLEDNIVVEKDLDDESGSGDIDVACDDTGINVKCYEELLINLSMISQEVARRTNPTSV